MEKSSKKKSNPSKTDNTNPPPTKKPRKKLVPINDAIVQSEEVVVKQCVAYLKSLGWVTKTLFTGGIPIGGGRYATNPAKGIPDSIAFHVKERRMVWIEYKKSKGGILSSEQIEWHNLLKHCGSEVWVINSIHTLEEHLNGTFSATG